MDPCLSWEITLLPSPFTDVEYFLRDPEKLIRWTGELYSVDPNNCGPLITEFYDRGLNPPELS